MSAYQEAVEYVKEKIQQAWDEKEYPERYDRQDVIHEELDYYVSTLYEQEVDDLILSYGLTKALREYDNQGFGDCPKTSEALLYVIMRAELE